MASTLKKLLIIKTKLQRKLQRRKKTKSERAQQKIGKEKAPPKD